MTEGVGYTQLCRDVAPFDPGPRATRAPEPGFAAAFDRSPWWGLCDAWTVPPSRASVGERVRSDVPVLILLGGLAATTPVADVRRETVGLTNRSIVVDPVGGHNSFVSSQCLLELRNTWLADPTSLAGRPACLQNQRLEWW